MLGDTRSDLIGVLAIVMGQAKAEATISDIETLIKKRAIEGVNAGIDAKMPDIRFQVRDEATAVAKPLFIGAAVAGGLGALLAVGAIIRTKRCTR
jgi:hypothetical protein